MNSEDRIELKKKIEEAIDLEQEKIYTLKDLTKPISPSDSIGRISRMDAINNKSINEAALRTSEAKMKNLKSALSKIDDKDFGICIKCKQEIPVGRLMLMPQSLKCVRCASR